MHNGKTRSRDTSEDAFLFAHRLSNGETRTVESTRLASINGTARSTLRPGDEQYRSLTAKKRNTSYRKGVVSVLSFHYRIEKKEDENVSRTTWISRRHEEIINEIRKFNG